MNKPPNSRQLLEDVLAEDSGDGFRERLLTDTLRRARRRHLIRGTRNSACVIAMLYACGFLVWQHLHPKDTHAAQAAYSYSIIATRPLPESSIVSTNRFKISSQLPSNSQITLVRTTLGGFRRIDDEALLALLSPRPVVLISFGPGVEEIVFANKADKLEILMN